MLWNLSNLRNPVDWIANENPHRLSGLTATGDGDLPGYKSDAAVLMPTTAATGVAASSTAGMAPATRCGMTATTAARSGAARITRRARRAVGARGAVRSGRAGSA